MDPKEEKSSGGPSNSANFHSSMKKFITANSALKIFELQPIRTKRVLYPTKPNSALQRIPVVGGAAISVDVANTLRNLSFGPSGIMSYFSCDWLESSFGFHEESTNYAWALKIPKETTKGLVLCVQAYFLKNLLFSRRRTRGSVDFNTLMKPDKRIQEECLSTALSDILWKAGDKTRATLCLVIENDTIENSEYFRGDGLTEKVRLFHFKKQDDLTLNMKKYLYQFVDDGKGSCGGGCTLFLYSLILTRGFERLKNEMEEEFPAAVIETGTLNVSISNLILTGRATPYFHNGIIYEGTEATMAMPKTGTLLRSEIGFLLWKGEGSRNVHVGSRLKTPSFPIWLTFCDNKYGLLFNSNKDLMRDYHAENRFIMFYYSGHEEKSQITTLTIDSREPKFLDPFTSPPLELLIQTKWEDASVNWNGENPYV